jgi:hypothetical protein
MIDLSRRVTISLAAHSLGSTAEPRSGTADSRPSGRSSLDLEAFGHRLRGCGEGAGPPRHLQPARSAFAPGTPASAPSQRRG